MFSYNFYATGTVWEIEVLDPIHESDFEYLKEQVLLIISDFEQKYSRFVKSSFISKLSRETGEIHITPDFVKMLRVYQRFYTLTRGKFTPLIGQMLEDAGYDADLSFEPKQLHDIPALDDVVAINGRSTIDIKKKASWDFGGVGKGFLIDKVAKYMKKSGLSDFSIYAGGDILTSNTERKTMKVGLENPFNKDEVIGVIEVANLSVCGSSINRRNWSEYSHIIDPDHKKSPVEIAATWTVSESATIADTAATCLFLVEPEALLKKYTFEYLILDKEMNVRKSDGFNADLFFSKSMPA